MRRFRFVFLITISITILLLEVAFTQSKEGFHQFTMENGLKVILKEDSTSPVVALQVWVKTGSADERDDEAGMCHFIEHMIFKGTEKRKVGAMAKEVESLGGSINAYTSYAQPLYPLT